MEDDKIVRSSRIDWKIINRGNKVLESISREVGVDNFKLLR